MRNKERVLIWLVIGMLFMAGLLLSLGSHAQTMPVYLNQNPAYWYDQYQDEQARANGLERSGKTAINGLQASLKVANDTIRNQANTITVLVGDRDKANKRAVSAETERDELKVKRRRDRVGATIVAILIFTLKSLL